MAGPQEHILDLPQERITGDILRGRGPRRGNLEALLRYWRPRMKLPGGFRRCLVTLADHPELYPLPNICAWLHHEVTGKWPNEGCHHPGMRNCRSGGKRVARAVTPGKSLRIISNTNRDAYQMARKNGSALFQPLNGDQNLVDFKGRFTAETGMPRWMGTLGSFAVPGEKPFFLHRNPIRTLAWHALTPGGGSMLMPNLLSGGGLGSLGSLGGLGGIGAGPFSVGLGGVSGPGGGAQHCPGGFEFGGRFTDKRASNCGQQLFTPIGSNLRTRGTEGGAWYSTTGEEPATYQSIGSQGEQAPSGTWTGTVGSEGGPYYSSTHQSATPPITVGSDETRPPQRWPKPVGTQQTIGRSGVKYPVAPQVGEKDASLQEKAVDAISKALSSLEESPGFPVARLVRQDGQALAALVPAEVLARQPHNRDMQEGVFITWASDPYTMGKAEIPMLGRGLRSIVFSLPGGGRVRVDRKGAITSEELVQLGSLLAAAPDVRTMTYSERLGRLVELSAGKLSLSVEYPNLVDPQEKVLVEDANGAKRQVPMWVFKAYLSEAAPARPKDRPAYKLVEKPIIKSHPASAEIDAKAARFGSFLSEARGQVQKKALRTPPPSGVL